MQNANRLPNGWGFSNLRVVATREASGGQESPNPGGRLFLLLLLLGVALIGYYFMGGDPPSPVVINEDGEEVLSPERQAKLDRELEEIDNTMQYALIADYDGYYPCYTCPNGSTTLFLYKGEIWKYGITRKGERKRYPGKSYGAPNLSFVVQFIGTSNECLKMEKIKIYHYPLLPEARKRKIRLFRPPGNANDH